MTTPDAAGEPVLLLGGTAEARALADDLVQRSLPVISSLAGRVNNPRLPAGDVRIGGFGGVDGLTRWIQDHRVAAIVDATHPFARRISAAAATAAANTSTPLLRLRRPAWQPGPGDRWITVPDMSTAATVVAERGRRVMLTTGRQDVDTFAGIGSAWFLIRVVDPPTGPVPPRHQILTSRGPYRADDEAAILAENDIDLLVTKNSGGDMTRGKLTAAAQLGIEVVMVARPGEPATSAVADTVDQARDWVCHLVDQAGTDLSADRRADSAGA